MLTCPSTLQVVDKDADAVLDEVEAAIFLVAQSILGGQGFSYAIPSRAKGNQLYVPEIDRIVLKDSASARPFANTSTCRLPSCPVIRPLAPLSCSTRSVYQTII